MSQSCLPCQFQIHESLSDTYKYSECYGKPSYNVSCDMPGQVPCMSWLILIMPLSISMLNCAISFGKRRAGELFYNDRSAQYRAGSPKSCVCVVHVPRFQYGNFHVFSMIIWFIGSSWWLENLSLPSLTHWLLRNTRVCKGLNGREIR